MNKKSIASLELSALVTELQRVVRSKVTHIYHQDDDQILLQFHTSTYGKQLLKIIPGKLLCFTSHKETPLRPSGLCMLMRKYLDNAFVKSISQKDAERIVIFEFDRQGTYYIVVELYSKGNVIVCDSAWQILGVLERQTWKDRVVKEKETYVFPQAGPNWLTVTEKELAQIISSSVKKNVATALATETGLGGVYAEEVCLRSGVAKDILPCDVTAKQAGLMYKALQEMKKLLAVPQGFLYPEQITPFALTGVEPIKILPTYNEAIDLLNPFTIKSPYEKKIASLERMISDQQETLRQLDESIIINTRKGELVYEKYPSLQKLLDIVREMRKTKDWKDVEKELRREKKIKSVDLKNKKIVIDL